MSLKDSGEINYLLSLSCTDRVTAAVLCLLSGVIQSSLWDFQIMREPGRFPPHLASDYSLLYRVPVVLQINVSYLGFPLFEVYPTGG